RAHRVPRFQTDDDERSPTSRRIGSRTSRRISGRLASSPPRERLGGGGQIPSQQAEVVAPRPPGPGPPPPPRVSLFSNTRPPRAPPLLAPSRRRPAPRRRSPPLPAARPGPPAPRDSGRPEFDIPTGPRRRLAEQPQRPPGLGGRAGGVAEFAEGQPASP